MAVERPDYDKDGRTSLAEAHAYVLINSDTIDIPVCTSDVLLRQFSKTKDAKVKDLVTAGTKFEELLKLDFDAAVPGNGPSLGRFRSQVAWLWLRTLRRRSQRGRMTWAQFALLSDVWIPRARILHPSPALRFDAKHPR